MAKKVITFKEALAFLKQGEKIKPDWIRGFDDLDTDQLALFQPVWHAQLAKQRAVLATALGELARDDIKTNFDAIFKTALSDADERVRQVAVMSLMENNEPSLIEPLVKLLQTDPSEAVRAAAADTLGHFALLGETDRVNATRKKLVYDALLKVFRHADESSLIYRNALQSLGYTTNETVSMYIRAAYASEDEQLRKSAVIAMGRSYDSRWLDFVRQELLAQLPEMRLEAVRAAGQLEDLDAVKELGQLLEDPDERVRFEALESLAMIGGDPARALLQQAVLGKDEAYVKQAEEALEMFDFYHGEIDFSMVSLDEEELKPRRVWQRKTAESDPDE